MNFAIVNLGCKVNKVESDAFAAGLLSRGCIETDQTQADVIVVNTCTVTGEAEKKTRKAVRRALRDSSTAHVVVTGCAAALDADTFLSMDPARVHVSGKLQVDSLLDQLVGPLEHDANVLAVGDGFRSRVGVKIQDGCNNACTYCIVHVARGKATSRSADEVIDECVKLAQAGVREIVLTGINLGSYRSAAVSENGTSQSDVCLDGLLERLLLATKDIHEADAPACRFRISSIEPRDVSDSLIHLMSVSQGRICRHLHLPLQSGSAKVLREMHRPYTVQYFVDLVEKLYKAMPNISLSTDIICGFPGESDTDFVDTLHIARSCRFSKIHVFPYSMRAGTPAADRDDQVDPQVKAQRATQLRNLSNELRDSDLTRRRGTCEFALVEEDGRAMTESYHEVLAPAGADAGSLVEVRL